MKRTPINLMSGILFMCLYCLPLLSVAQNKLKAVSPKSLAKGQALFDALCSSCHNFSQRVIGPELGTVMSAAPADWIKNMIVNAGALIEKGDKKEIAIMQVIQKYIVSSKKILFEGDGYSEAWHQEAEKRGLPNLKTTPVALDAMVTEKSKKLFKDNGIFTHAELEARYEIELETYIKKVQIEARVMGDLATNHIIPAAIKYQNELLKNVSLLREAALPEKLYKGQLALLKDVSTHIQQVYDNVDAMVEARKVANNIVNSREKAIEYEAKVKAQYFDKIRYHVDKLEQLVDDELWTLPKYREMLFLR